MTNLFKDLQLLDDQLARIRLQLLQARLRDEATGSEVYKKGTLDASVVQLHKEYLRKKELQDKLQRDLYLQNEIKKDFEKLEALRPPVRKYPPPTKSKLDSKAKLHGQGTPLSRDTTTPTSSHEKKHSATDLLEMMLITNAETNQILMKQLILKNAQPATTAADGNPVAIHHHHYPPQTGPPNPYYPAPGLWNYLIPMPVVPQTKGKQKTAFPGSLLLRRFRRRAYCVFFVRCLQRIARKQTKKHNTIIDEDFMIAIRIKEVIRCLHSLYLKPGGDMFPVLKNLISDNQLDLSLALTSTDRPEEKESLARVKDILEQIIRVIIGIKPSKGLLGTETRSFFYKMARGRKIFPIGVLWQCEKDQIHLDSEGRTGDFDDSIIPVLVLVVFISRGLVSTLFLKPIDYRLLQREPSNLTLKNLKLMSTLLVYLVRKATVPLKAKPMSFPYELKPLIYSDEDISTLVKKMKEALNFNEGLLRTWIDYYIDKLRDVK